MSTSIAALLGACGFVIGSALAFYVARSIDRVRHDYRSTIDYRSKSITDPEYRQLISSLSWAYRGSCVLTVLGAGVVIAAIAKAQFG